MNHVFIYSLGILLWRLYSLVLSETEHVSGAWAADLPLTAQAYFCDTRSPIPSNHML